MLPSRSRRARSAPRCRAASAPCWCSVLKIEPEKVRPFEDVAERAQARSRQRARQGRDPSALRQDRGRALDRQAAGRDGREAQARSAHRRDRPLRPRPVGRAGAQAAGCAAPARGGVRGRRRRRERSAAGRGRLRLVRGRRASRRRATARSTRSRSRSRRAGATTQVANRLQDQGGRDPRQAQGRHAARRGRRADGLKVETQPGSSAAEPRLRCRRATVDAIFRTAKDALGSAPKPRSPASRSCSASPTSSMPTLDLESEETKRLRDTLNRSVTDDVFGGVHRPARERDRRDDQRSALQQVLSGRSLTDN